MELEEAIKQLRIIINNIAKERRNNIASIEGIMFQEAIEVVLSHLTKQEKMIELMAEELAFGVFDFKSKEQAKQYFEKKAEENK